MGKDPSEVSVGWCALPTLHPCIPNPRLPCNRVSHGLRGNPRVSGFSWWWPRCRN